MQLTLPSPIQKIEHELFETHNVTVYVKRDDLIHTVISGNKWRKLALNSKFCVANKYKGMATYGGAHSNHLLATAFLGFHYNYETIGYVRGEPHNTITPTLNQCKEFGMHLEYLSREDYRKLSKTNALQKSSNIYGVPEGGANELGVEGCVSIVTEINLDFDYISVDCGTGATLAGMVRSLKPHQMALGISVLKGGGFLYEEVNKLNSHLPKTNFDIITDYHFGGYARYTPNLIAFMQKWYLQTGIKTDPIYTGKQFFAIIELLKKGYFKPNSTIVIVHTGGLQGIEGFEKRYNLNIY